MYEPFFGMERRPFSATPDAGCFFISDELQAVLDELVQCVERGQGIGILTAPAGMGKTLLCQRLNAALRGRADQIQPSDRDQANEGNRFECVYLSNSNFPTRRSLLQAILFEMGDEYSRRDEPELRLDLRSRLLSLRPQREALVLIVDEAHLFGDELLEELRTMADLADDGRSLVRVILSGQLDLEERLTDRTFDALNQRVSNHVFLEPLSISESAAYLSFRIEWAGGEPEEIFSEEAIDVITRASGGVPRCLNQLADHCLLLAFASDEKPVSAKTVREALEDLKQLPLQWQDVADTATVGSQAEDRTDPDVDNSGQEASSTETEISDRGSESDATKHSSDIEAEAEVKSEEPPVERVAPPPELDGGLVLDFSSDDADSHDSEHVEVRAELDNDGPHDFETAEQTLLEVVQEPESEFEAETHDDTSCEIAAESWTDDEEATEPSLESIDESLPEEMPDGISFQITSQGFEIAGFGPPEPVTVDEPVNETADDPICSHDEQEPVDSAADDHDDETDSQQAEEEVVVAESSDATVQEQVIEIAFVDEPDSELADEIASVEIEVDPDGIAPVAETAETIAEPSEVTESFGTTESCEETSHETFAEASGDAADTHETEDPIMTVETPTPASVYEEELVFDPYAVLQEPESSGIVWNFGTSTAFTPPEDEVSEEHLVEEPCYLVDVDTAAEDLSGIDSESQATAPGNPVEDVPDDDNDASTEGLAQSLQPLGIEDQTSVASPSIEAENIVEDVIEELSGDTDQGEQLEIVADAEGENSIEPIAGDSRIGDEADAETLEAEESVSVEGEIEEHGDVDEPENHDVVLPVEVRNLQPDRIVDTVLPLLDELDEGLDTVPATRPVSERSVIDIEAELIETIEHCSNAVEDEIGATVLDICLDTQSALQESAIAQRLAESEAETELDATDDDEAEFPPSAFDIVQPEPEEGQVPRRGFPETKARKEEAKQPAAPSGESEQNKAVDKPFGRLFSDLRRRQR